MDNENIVKLPGGMGLMSDIMFMQENENLTKVSFPCVDAEVENENMWVRITEGDQKRGRGILDNIPAYATYVKHEDVIEFPMVNDDDIRPTFVCKIEKELTPDDVKEILASQAKSKHEALEDEDIIADGEGFLPKGTNVTKWEEEELANRPPEWDEEKDE